MLEILITKPTSIKPHWKTLHMQEAARTTNQSVYGPDSSLLFCSRAGVGGHSTVVTHDASISSQDYPKVIYLLVNSRKD